MSISHTRSKLQRALIEWRDAGGHVEDVTDYIEGLISAKVDEILEARAANASQSAKSGVT